MKTNELVMCISNEKSVGLVINWIKDWIKDDSKFLSLKKNLDKIVPFTKLGKLERKSFFERKGLV